MKRAATCFLIVSFMFISGFTSFDVEPDITGDWIREGDNLRIKITKEDSEKLRSFIVQEGNEKFPCTVSHLPIYKNIIQVKEKLWKCDFLVVTMGSCTTGYEEGFIQVLKNGAMEIICPGYEKKVYKKLKPRYEND